MDNNNLLYDYIGATGTHTTTDYIDYNSNILDNKIIITSNILDTKINITSNYLRQYTNTNIIDLDNKYNKLIKEQTGDNTINDTYITNSNIGGEIKFYVKQSGIFDINNASGQIYRVKIGNDGKLYLYYNYNIAIGILETERWVEPVNMLISHNVALGNLNAITGATDITIGKILIDIKQLNSLVISENIITNADRLILRDTSSLYGNLKIVFEKIKNSITYVNALYAGIVGSIGFGLIFMGYGYIQSRVNADYIENNVKYQLSNNTVMTSTEKQQLLIDSFNVYNSNLNDMIYYNCNLNILSGFINSNIQTSQTIPNISTNAITYNGVEISNGFLSLNGNKTFSGTLTNTGTIINNGSITGTGNISITGNITQNGQSIATISQNTILNNTPNVSKKYGFNFSCSYPIVIVSSVYYKYDIDLRNYTQTKSTPNGSLYRIFNIRIWLGTSYFETTINNEYNILSYEVYQSNQLYSGTPTGQIGINIFANPVGATLPNPKLANVLPSYFTLMRTTDFNYLSVITTISGLQLLAVIEDILY